MSIIDDFKKKKRQRDRKKKVQGIIDKVKGGNKKKGLDVNLPESLQKKLKTKKSYSIRDILRKLD